MYCGPPDSMEVSPKVARRIRGESFEARCSAYVGQKWHRSNYSVEFYKSELKDEKEFLSLLKANNASLNRYSLIFARKTINVDFLFSYEKISKGFVEAILELDKLKPNDFGQYVCKVTNFEHSKSASFSLIDGGN